MQQPHAILIVLRGNSGSGKSSVARALRARYGRGVAWVSQDLIRRILLQEDDRPGGRNIGLIDQITRYALAQGYHVVLDGIFTASRYEHMLAALYRDHDGPAFCYYLDASLDETIRRHSGRPEATQFSADDMRSWYRPRDLLSAVPEQVVPETSTLAETVDRILAETGLPHSVILRAEPAAESDIPSWLELVRQVEPLFGPMPDFIEHARRGIRRGSALVVRDPAKTVIGAALLSDQAAGRHIRWLAVRADMRRRGAGTVLLAEILRRWSGPGDIEVVTFGPDVNGGQPARALYQSFGFVPGPKLADDPGGGSRQLFVLERGEPR
jgi:GNAT superfamily N-acetyltransferase/predicted kinase